MLSRQPAGPLHIDGRSREIGGALSGVKQFASRQGDLWDDEPPGLRCLRLTLEEPSDGPVSGRTLQREQSMLGWLLLRPLRLPATISMNDCARERSLSHVSNCSPVDAAAR